MSVCGVWMWSDSILLHGAERTVSYCAQAGVTDIYFLVKGLKGTIAYPSAYAPPASQRDLLKELLDAAHARGIRVHAWFTSTCDNNYKTLYPESGRCHYIRGKDRELIALTDEGYLSYMQSIVSEVCRTYNIDGLHLDYIRYNHLLYGWSEEDIRRYEAEGADIAHLRSLIEKTFYEEEKDPDCIFSAFRSGDPSVLALAHVRRKDVVRFAETLIRTARNEKENLIISAALMPEGAYDDISFSDLHYGQNYEDAARLYDYVLPMAYTQAYKQDEKWLRMVAEGTMRRGLTAVMGLHAYEGGTGLSAENACQKCELSASIAPGEDQTFVLSLDSLRLLRAFSEDNELCVYLISDHTVI